MRNLFLFGTIFLWSSAFATGVSAQPTPALNAEISAFSERIRGLEKTYLKPATLSSKYKLEARFNDAFVAYEIKDYERASYLFIDVVSSERFRNFPTYRQAHFLLGDSLMQMRNYVAAKYYLEQLVSLGQGEYFSEGGAKLMEIAYRTSDYSSIDAIYANMKTGKMSPALYYLSGKAFYEKKEFSKARENFQRSVDDKNYTKLSNYFIGVSFASEKKFAEAKSYFEKVLKVAAANERDIEVDDLTYIALGRIAYEVAELEVAIDFYNRVGRGSKHFDRALWELTWVLVSKKEYLSARTNIDVLVLFENGNPNLIAEANLLRADLSLRLKEYDAALVDYETVINKFSPLSVEMNTFTAQHKNIDDFFTALVRDEFAGVESDLPPLVKKWTANDPKMKKSMQTLKDVKVIEDDIAYSFRLLDEMDARLGSSSKVMSVPELAEGLMQGIDAENRIITIQRKLVDRQAELVTMTGASKAQWLTKLDTLNSMQSLFQELPQTRADITERDNAKLKEFTDMRKTLDDISFEIKNQKAQIEALDNYMSERFGRKLTETEKVEFPAYREKLRKEVADTISKKAELEAGLSNAKASLRASNDLAATETVIRDNYRAKLKEAQMFLSQFGTSSELTQIKASQDMIPGHEQRLKAFYAQLDTYAETALVEIRAEVAKQRALESSYKESVAQLMSARNSGAGTLAYINFMAARRQFNETVLKGDVGIIDVVWERKDDRSNKIGQMFEDRANQLKRLQESFDEVR